MTKFYWNNGNIPVLRKNSLFMPCESVAKCGKRGLVPIDSTPIESKKKQHPHCTVKVGCLYCAAKGSIKMPKRRRGMVLTQQLTPQLLEQAPTKTTLESS